VKRKKKKKKKKLFPISQFSAWKEFRKSQDFKARTVSAGSEIWTQKPLQTKNYWQVACHVYCPVAFPKWSQAQGARLLGYFKHSCPRCTNRQGQCIPVALHGSYCVVRTVSSYVTKMATRLKENQTLQKSRNVCRARSLCWCPWPTVSITNTVYAIISQTLTPTFYATKTYLLTFTFVFPCIIV